MAEAKKLDFTLPDTRGYVPDLSKRYTVWIHAGNKKEYVITGFEWDAERDIWVYQITRVDTVMPATTRSPQNFHEYVEKFESTRFVQTKW